jgi:hypothetical protein
LVAAVMPLACRSTGPDNVPTEAEELEMLSLMLPHAIEIQPFTKIASFNDDEIPDGIVTVVRPVDRFGDPVKAVGRFYFELWTYVDASALRRGERLAFWERMIATEEEVRLYWNRGQMYQFELAWTAGMEQLRPGRKFILAVTYRTPWGKGIEDEYVMEFYASPAEMQRVLTGSPEP